MKILQEIELDDMDNYLISDKVKMNKNIIHKGESSFIEIRREIRASTENEASLWECRMIKINI